MKQRISEILVKWGMPTRQAAINEIMKLYEVQAKKTTPASKKRKIKPTVVGKQ